MTSLRSILDDFSDTNESIQHHWTQPLSGYFKARIACFWYCSLGNIPVKFSRLDFRSLRKSECLQRPLHKELLHHQFNHYDVLYVKYVLQIQHYCGRNTRCFRANMWKNGSLKRHVFPVRYFLYPNKERRHKRESFCWRIHWLHHTDCVMSRQLSQTLRQYLPFQSWIPW